MKYQLIQPINEKYTAQEQILVNRNIKYEDIEHYLNTTDKDINDFNLLGKEKLAEAAKLILDAIEQNLKIGIIVDSDNDGMTASAILINYLYKINSTFVENNINWFIHEGKQHGLEDYVKWVIRDRFNLVICPDSSSNDKKEHLKLAEYDIKVIILDHHELEIKEAETPAIIINSQLEPYPNKELSGAGVVYQFCRYLDKILNVHYADYYLDLVASGLSGDVMSLRSIETKHLINKGFEPENIHNPFLYKMWQKNLFKLGDHITPWGAVFYIIPFVNAIVRSGTPQEKELIFESMLDFKGNEEILSTKKGHQADETETIAEQAVRTCVNVKNRQEKSKKEFLSKLEDMIVEQDLLAHKVLLFLIDDSKGMNKNIAGLCAGSLASKYFRPTCILIKDKITNTYMGSARGSDKTGVTNFREICLETNAVKYASGHSSAFGLSIAKKNIEDFINKTDKALKDINDEVIYYVDYIYNDKNVKFADILSIAKMDNLWGKDVEEAYIAIENLKITKDMILLMSPDKNPTLKITLPNRISLIKFKSSQSEYDNLISEGYIKMNLVGKCNANTWQGETTPQILVEDYEITERVRYYF